MSKMLCKPATMDIVKEKKSTTSTSKAAAQKKKKAKVREDADKDGGSTHSANFSTIDRGEQRGCRPLALNKFELGFG